MPCGPRSTCTAESGPSSGALLSRVRAGRGSRTPKAPADRVRRDPRGRLRLRRHGVGAEPCPLVVTRQCGPVIFAMNLILRLRLAFSRKRRGPRQTRRAAGSRSRAIAPARKRGPSHRGRRLAGGRDFPRNPYAQGLATKRCPFGAGADQAHPPRAQRKPGSPRHGRENRR